MPFFDAVPPPLDEYFRALNAGEFDRVLELVHPDAVGEVISPDGSPRRVPFVELVAHIQAEAARSFVTSVPIHATTVDGTTEVRLAVTSVDYRGDVATYLQKTRYTVVDGLIVEVIVRPLEPRRSFGTRGA